MSLESITDTEHAKLRKQYLKDANKFYRKNIRQADKYRFLNYIGAGLMAAGICRATQMKNWWFALLCGAPGAVIIGESIFRRRRIRKDNMAVLEKEVSDMGYAELEKRMNDRNYGFSGPDEESIQQKEMGNYSQNVIYQVIRREHRLITRLPTIAGVGAIFMGSYLAQMGHLGNSSSSILAGLTFASMGVVTIAIFGYNNVKKMRRLSKDIERVINEKGYEFMQLHANKKNPYDFYQRHILPELQSKQKD